MLIWRINILCAQYIVLDKLQWKHTVLFLQQEDFFTDDEKRNFAEMAYMSAFAKTRSFTKYNAKNKQKM